MVYLDVSVAHGHELDGHAADNAPADERPQIAEEDVVLVFRYAVVHLYGQVIDVWLLPLGNVLLEQPVEGLVQCRADEVTACKIHKAGGKTDICDDAQCSVSACACCTTLSIE